MPPPTNSNQVLTAHLNRLLKGSEGARIDLGRRMGVGDGTLGRIKYGKANATLEVVDKIARFYRVPAWTLIKPEGEGAAALTPDAQRFAELFTALPPDKQRAIKALMEP